MEVREIKTKQIDERCPICGDKNSGWMRPTGIVSQTTPPQFEHKCTQCGYKQTYSVRYPYFVQ